MKELKKLVMHVYFDLIGQEGKSELTREQQLNYTLYVGLGASGFGGLALIGTSGPLGIVTGLGLLGLGGAKLAIWLKIRKQK